jgi:hypothetical protein
MDLSALPDQHLDHLIQAIQTRQAQTAQRNPGTSNRGSRGNKRNGNVDRSMLKCLHCNRTGHGIVECFKRIEDELPCYNQKEEPFYPATDKAKREELLKKKNKNLNTATESPVFPHIGTFVTAPCVNTATEDRDQEQAPPTGQINGTKPKEGSVFPNRV